MILLTSLDQLSIGTRLRIIAKSKRDCYGSISVKKIIPMCNRYGDNSLLSAGPNDTEILINKSKNFYFSMNKYLNGNSCWVKEIFVLDGIDKRLKKYKRQDSAVTKSHHVGKVI